MMTDRLALAHVIEDAGIERNKAERVAAATCSRAQASDDQRQQIGNILPNGV